MNRVTLRAALVLGSVFVCGALVGGAGVKVWTERQVIDDLTAGPGRRFAHHFLQDLADELSLSRTRFSGSCKLTGLKWTASANGSARAALYR